MYPRYVVLASVSILLACAGGLGSAAGTEAPPGGRGTHVVYVAAESADLLHRIRFADGRAVLERTIPVGELASETEGPHGLNVSGDGRFLYLTTGHGMPDGKLWKLRAGPDTLVAAPVPLGFFPATVDVTPDGLYAFVANFNLHGEHEPSSVSVVFTPDMVEVDRIETCVMPHGARLAPGGAFLYSACMMDDQLVEVDTRSFRVSRRFSVAVGSEGPLEGTPRPGAMATCGPTWVTPAPDGETVYVACNRADRVLEIDRTEWRLRRSLSTGAGPYNMAVTHDGSRLVVTLKGDAAVQVFDLREGAALATLPSTTTLPHGVVVSPDGQYAFVSVEGVGAEPGKVDVFDLERLERVADVEVGQQAGGIVLWPGEPTPPEEERRAPGLSPSGR